MLFRKLTAINLDNLYSKEINNINQQLVYLPLVFSDENTKKYLHIKDQVNTFLQSIVNDLIRNATTLSQEVDLDYIDFVNVLNNKNSTIASDIKKIFTTVSHYLDRQYNYQWLWNIELKKDSILISYQNFMQREEFLDPEITAKSNEGEYVRNEIIFNQKDRKFSYELKVGSNYNSLESKGVSTIENITKLLSGKDDCLVAILNTIQFLSVITKNKNFVSLLSKFNSSYIYYENELGLGNLSTEEQKYFMNFPFPEKETRLALQFFKEQKGYFKKSDVLKDPLYQLIGAPKTYRQFKVTEVIVGPTKYNDFGDIINVKENQFVFSYDDIACLSGTAGTYLFEILPDGSIKIIKQLSFMMS